MISSTNIHRLVPEFLLDSDLLMIVVLDVEGRILKSNSLFTKLTGRQRDFPFVELLQDDSQHVFEQMTENLLLCPKQNHRVGLELMEGLTFRSCVISWEFSVVTDADMDIMGIVGMGMAIPSDQTHEQIRGLVDLLSLAHLELDDQLYVLPGDFEAFAEIGLAVDHWAGKHIREIFPDLDKDTLDGMKSHRSGVFKSILDSESGKMTLVGIQEQSRCHLFFSHLEAQAFTNFDEQKPFRYEQIQALPNPVWIVTSRGILVQQNDLAQEFSIHYFEEKSTEGIKLAFPETKFDKSLQAFLIGQSSTFLFEKLDGQLEQVSYDVSFGKIHTALDQEDLILVQATRLTLGDTIERLRQENKRLKEIALRPSHILRSPLSSMLGLLDLIDADKLDSENRTYFSYLKPLATQLDEVIRSTAKKRSALN